MSAVRNGVLEVFKGMEIGHIFKLGTKYSESMGATVLTQDGKQVPIVMGSYGIGVERIITAAVEQQHDDDGIIWPKSLAPFDVVVTITNMKQDDLREAGEKALPRIATRGSRSPARRSRRTRGREVQRRGSDRHSLSHHDREKSREGVVELFDRRAKQSEDVKISDVVAALTGNWQFNSRQRFPAIQGEIADMKFWLLLFLLHSHRGVAGSSSRTRSPYQTLRSCHRNFRLAR